MVQEEERRAMMMSLKRLLSFLSSFDLSTATVDPLILLNHEGENSGGRAVVEGRETIRECLSSRSTGMGDERERTSGFFGGCSTEGVGVGRRGDPADGCETEAEVVADGRAEEVEAVEGEGDVTGR